MTQTTAEPEATIDVGTERLAHIYATALLDAADKAGQTNEMLAETDALIDLFQTQPQLETFFASPAVGRRARTAALEKAFTGRASDLFLRFLLVLNEHERLGLVRPIREALHDIYNERHKRIVVHVYSAVPLTDQQRETIANGVRKRFGLEPILAAHVDPSLLGGLKIRVGDRQYDATVRTRLDDIRNQILSRSSYEIQSRRDRFSHQ